MEVIVFPMSSTLFLITFLTSSASVLGVADLMKKARRLEMKALSMAIPGTMKMLLTAFPRVVMGGRVAVTDSRDRCEGPPKDISQIPYP